MTLTEFLTARLDEDEAVAKVANPHDASIDFTEWTQDDWEQDALNSERWGMQPHSRTCGWRQGEGMQDGCTCGYPARVLAEVEAKRRIVERYEFALSTRVDARPGVAEVLTGAVRLLALTYADHPDYDEAWRP